MIISDEYFSPIFVIRRWLFLQGLAVLLLIVGYSVIGIFHLFGFGGSFFVEYFLTGSLLFLVCIIWYFSISRFIPKSQFIPQRILYVSLWGFTFIDLGTYVLGNFLLHSLFFM